MVNVVRAVAAGDAVLAPAGKRQLLDRAGRRPPAAVTCAPEALAQFTAREQARPRDARRGVPNAEISDALVPFEATGQTHVSSVLGKLGLHYRVQAAIYAYEIGLIRT